MTVFAKQEGVSRNALYRWRRLLGEPTPARRFVEVAPVPDLHSSPTAPTTDIAPTIAVHVGTMITIVVPRPELNSVVAGLLALTQGHAAS